ncbi:hypothetical protein LCGC14_0611080 [marine sediment metagenome]|uniref:Uncharacterized protein n=1 Tax=marine sediment metagenome TaxID=412755 RepID=A0A0F9TTU4_9ZZZZ
MNEELREIIDDFLIKEGIDGVHEICAFLEKECNGFAEEYTTDEKDWLDLANKIGACIRCHVWLSK